ncbi:MAG: sporulation integral membrane protein YtvI [Oscillospiraceae bacterium]
MYTKLPHALLILLYGILTVAAAWICLRYLLPVMAPFIIAFALAALLEPAVRFLCRHRWPRSLASGLCTIALVFFIGWLLVLVIGRGIAELGKFAGNLSELFGNLAVTLEGFKRKISGLIDSSPDHYGKYLQTVLESLDRQLYELPGKLSGELLSFVSNFAGKTPAVFLFAVTCGIGVYFISASYPSILAFVKRQIPQSWRGRASIIHSDFSLSLGNWLKAQLIMILITFCELLVAFTLLKQDYAIILSAAIAIIDALPVLGTGTVLVPWMVYEFLTGNYPLGLGLLITYLAITLVRNCIQPKLLGDSLGLHPVVALVAVYAGYCFSGIWGMLILPILAVMVKQLNDRGIIRLWKKEEDV